MALTRRFATHAADDACAYGMDFSAILPWGVAITSATFQIHYNQPGLANDDASGDWDIGITRFRDRLAFTILKNAANPTGGDVHGKDYVLQWEIVDTRGNTWIRSGVLLVGRTS